MVATLDELDEAALIQILTEPKNALLKQYQKMFAMEGVELEVRPEALQAVATKALARRTGARGLRSILEQALLDTMFDLPSLSNVRKVVIDEGTITGDRQAAADLLRPAQGGRFGAVSRRLPALAAGRDGPGTRDISCDFRRGLKYACGCPT